MDVDRRFVTLVLLVLAGNGREGRGMWISGFSWCGGLVSC